MTREAPLPPFELALRVGDPGPGLSLEGYEREGRAIRERLEALLPPDWDFNGRRVLDFGCGVGRTLSQFLDEAEQSEFWGCDIHEPSIAWIHRNLSPPINAFANRELPPLPLATDYFDLVWATSVFSHLADSWSAWAVELHRVLAPGGLIIVSYLGAGIWDAILRRPYVEDELGRTVLRHWQPWEREGGPLAFHSEWWLREHWGRGFDVTQVKRPPDAADGSCEVTHSYLVARKRPAPLTVEELERIDPGDPREIAGLQTSIRLLTEEAAWAIERQGQPWNAVKTRLRRNLTSAGQFGRLERLRRRWGRRPGS